jgi:hypothetical protein
MTDTIRQKVLEGFDPSTRSARFQLNVPGPVGGFPVEEPLRPLSLFSGFATLVGEDRELTHRLHFAMRP